MYVQRNSHICVQQINYLPTKFVDPKKLGNIFKENFKKFDSQVKQ